MFLTGLFSGLLAALFLAGAKAAVLLSALLLLARFLRELAVAGLVFLFWLMDASPFSRVHPYYARFGGRYSLDATFLLCHNTERDFLPQNTRKHKICSNFFAILSPS